MPFGAGAERKIRHWFAGQRPRERRVLITSGIGVARMAVGRPWRLWISSEDERHQHLGRMPVDRVGVGELLGQVALLDGRAIDEVDPR